MTKQYNDSLNNTFKDFILRVVATALAILGLCLITGVVKIEKVHDVHTAEVYLDGIEVQSTELSIFTGWNVKINLNLNEEGYIGL